MYLSDSDGGNGADVDDNTEAHQGNTPPASSVSPQSPTVSCPTLLVVDDNSNSNESPVTTTDIPSNSVPSSTTATNIQTNHLQPAASPAVSSNDTTNDTPEQQRRRNSSIAKLLGGQPLNNQQYEEIHQQILDDQSAQNGLNDNGTDSGIARSRSSITRTLLANAERNNANNNTNNMSKGRPESPEFAKNFEYLIRRELDIDHASLPLHTSSAPSVFQNLSTARNTPPLRTSSPSQSKLKRKRSLPRPSLPSVSSGKPSGAAPFALRNPFELDSSAPSLVPPSNLTVHHRSHHQNDLFRFEHPHRHPTRQLAPQYSMPMNGSPSGNPSVYPNHKPNSNSSVYPQFSIHADRLPSTPSSTTSSSSSSSSSYNFCHYPPPGELALPTPISSISTHASSPSLVQSYPTGSSSRKIKTMHRPDLYDIPIQRSYPTMSNQSNSSASSFSSAPSSPSGQSAPLKKRLLHAYINEQRPSSSL